MTHLIDKSALVAEIRKRRNKHFNSGGSPSSEYCHEDDEILGIIDTFEVKEINSVDVFVEKASEWLSKHAIKYYLDGSLGTDELVEDFKIAMTL